MFSVSWYIRCAVLVLAGLAAGAGPVVVAGLRVSTSVVGGVECFVEVGINEAADVAVVYSAVSRKNSGFSIRAEKRNGTPSKGHDDDDEEEEEEEEKEDEKGSSEDDFT
eukprot:1138746-Pelagomonas_calceolata.AAC.2